MCFASGNCNLQPLPSRIRWIHILLACENGGRRNEMAEDLKAVRILYTNYRSETSLRSIVPERIWLGAHCRTEMSKRGCMND